MAVFDCAALVFDLDGVLVDSTACVEQIWRRWAEQHGLDAAAILEVSHGRRTADTLRLVAPHLDVDAEVAALAASEARARAGVCEVPGAKELLSGLPPTAWGIVTSAVRAVAEYRLRLTGLPVPQVMVCAENVARGKPDPEGYLAAATLLGARPADCVVVEDAPPGIAAAHAAGMRAIALATTYPSVDLEVADAVTDTLTGIRVASRSGALRVMVQ
jgi:sugar-phosphatase